jgi:acyl-CoA synthetase (AMP-forming)/AMP-acid ligase II
MTDTSVSSVRASWRERWYAEGWYSADTCIDVLHRSAVEHDAARVVFVSRQVETTMTVGHIHRDARAVAAGLQRRGVRPGDAVAVQLTNRWECVVAYEAVLLCGAVLVPIVHVYGTTEVTYILADSAAKMLLMPATLRSTSLLERVPRYAGTGMLEHVVVIDAPHPSRTYLRWADLVGDAEDYRVPTIRSDDVCVLLYTSGTVSAPKGVRHSHNSVLAEQDTLRDLLRGDCHDVHLVTFPPGHVAGLSSIMRPLISGTASVFLDQWEPRRAADVIARYSVTATSGAPFHLQGLLQVDDVETKCATLQQFLTGAATVTEELGRRAEAAGITAHRCYGMTEHPTVTGALATDPLMVRMATDGAPMAGSACRIIDENGVDAPLGVDGEVVVQGPDQFVGYHDSSLDDGAYTADGWFRTGDLGHLDGDGRLTITDRIKDVIIRGGETISSAQIEDVLCDHPAVAEGAAIAAPDDRYGEVVAAVVVLEPGTELDLDALRRHFASSGLARQKSPERLVVVDVLPRTALGKIRKADLRRTHFTIAP